MWPIYLDVLSGVEGKGYVGVALAKRVLAECPQRQRSRRGLLPFQENICICLCVCVYFTLCHAQIQRMHIDAKEENQVVANLSVLIAIFLRMLMLIQI